MTTRWQQADALRGDAYDARWRALAEAGENIHGEADLVQALLAEHGGSRVLDAGCGTGRVAIELARRGFPVLGVDADPAMLAAARANAPELTWLDCDLAELPAELGTSVPQTVDLVLLAGNVMIFLTPGTEGDVLSNLADLLTPGGLLVAGFSLRPGQLSLGGFDGAASAAGLVLRQRWATWDRQPFDGGDYAVSVLVRQGRL